MQLQARVMVGLSNASRNLEGDCQQGSQRERDINSGAYITQGELAQATDE